MKNRLTWAVHIQGLDVSRIETPWYWNASSVRTTPDRSTIR